MGTISCERTHLGNQVRNWRGETQLHLAAETGIGQGYLSDLEGGRRTGTPETIAKIAQALNVPVGWLS